MMMGTLYTLLLKDLLVPYYPRIGWWENSQVTVQTLIFDGKSDGILQVFP